MLAVWKQGKGLVRDFLEQHEAPKPHYNTLSSTIRNLKKNGWLSSKNFGPVKQYTPLVTEAEYKNKFMTGFVHNYFQNSYKELVSFFAREMKITARELEEILDLIGKKK
jgi:BlaI family penicillinase repressor